MQSDNSTSNVDSIYLAAELPLRLCVVWSLKVFSSSHVPGGMYIINRKSTRQSLMEEEREFVGLDVSVSLSRCLSHSHIYVYGLHVAHGAIGRRERNGFLRGHG